LTFVRELISLVIKKNLIHIIFEFKNN
jgi:hypothetical protein